MHPQQGDTPFRHCIGTTRPLGENTRSIAGPIDATCRLLAGGGMMGFVQAYLYHFRLHFLSLV